jgi:SAM-dependent methyltransferase
MTWLATSFAPILVITARLRNALLPWYSRRHAEGYESKRQGKRWRAETRAFRSLYERVNPRTVLDCPAGTGRWFDIYQEHGAAVVGIDLSNDMLAQAAKKIHPEARIALKQGDLLATNGADLGTGYDLIVCIRFAHWLRFADLRGLIARFSETGSRFLILGARVKESEADKRARTSRRGWLARLKHMASFSHVHDETQLLAALGERGWALVRRAPIGRGGSWFYFFYLLRRAEPPRP